MVIPILFFQHAEYVMNDRFDTKGPTFMFVLVYLCFLFYQTTINASVLMGTTAHIYASVHGGVGIVDPKFSLGKIVRQQ